MLSRPGDRPGHDAMLGLARQILTETSGAGVYVYFLTAFEEQRDINERLLFLPMENDPWQFPLKELIPFMSVIKRQYDSWFLDLAFTNWHLITASLYYFFQIKAVRTKGTVPIVSFVSSAPGQLEAPQMSRRVYLPSDDDKAENALLRCFKQVRPPSFLRTIEIAQPETFYGYVAKWVNAAREKASMARSVKELMSKALYKQKGPLTLEAIADLVMKASDKGTFDLLSMMPFSRICFCLRHVSIFSTHFLLIQSG